jgi:NAD(P)H dehydrogenase (quinone)
MILITGAGGKTGRALIKTLSKAESVFAFVHRPESAAIVRSLGAGKWLVGNLGDRAARRYALAGVRAVYHICPNMSAHELEIGQLALAEARSAGVEHFVYHSVLHPHTEKMPHHWHKSRVEETIFESGLPYTILQPAPYMQNLLAGWETAAAEGVLKVPYSIESKFSFVDLADVAEAGRIVLTSRDHFGATYELVGEDSLSYAEVAALMAQALDRPVRAAREAIDEWQTRSGNIPGDELAGLRKMFEYYDRWGLRGNSTALKWLLGRDPVSLESFIKRIVMVRLADH